MRLNLKIVVSLLLLSLLIFSCKKAKKYFHDPETEPIAHVVKTAAAIGYSASIAMSVMAGEQIPFVITTGNCTDFPCISISLVNISNDNQVLFSGGSIGEITIAAFWPDEDAGILSIIFTDINISTQDFTLLNVHTVPVIKEEDKIIVVFAGNDININSDSESLLDLDLSQGEIDFEISRIENERPNDLYVAVKQDAWFIDIDQKATEDYFADDSYWITGGGQIIEATSISGGIIQQAMLHVELNSSCQRNPVSGYALIKNTSVEEKKIPELGTAIMKFHNYCDGLANIQIATGVYLKSNGRSVPLLLDD